MKKEGGEHIVQRRRGLPRDPWELCPGIPVRSAQGSQGVRKDTFFLFLGPRGPFLYKIPSKSLTKSKK